MDLNEKNPHPMNPESNLSSNVRWKFPIKKDPRFILVFDDQKSLNCRVFRSIIKKGKTMYVCKICNQLQKLVGASCTSESTESMPVLERVPEPKEHVCLPMTKSEAMKYVLKLAQHKKNKNVNRVSEVRFTNVSEVIFTSDPKNETPKTVVRIVEDSDILPFLIKEPNNPTFVRRFIGSNTGLVCQFCKDNGNQVIGVFSEAGKLAITGEHLPSCKPFDLAENSKSTGCQTIGTLESPNQKSDYEMTGNILKVGDREYFDSDGDGTLYYCKFCLRTKKTVVEAKVKTIVLEDEHCLECEETRRKTENKENCPPESESKFISPDSKRPEKRPLPSDEDYSNFPIYSELNLTRIKIPDDSFKFDYNGKKSYILLKNPSNPEEGWEFMSHVKFKNKTMSYRCLSCASYYLKFYLDLKELYCTPRRHSCKCIPMKLLEEKYEDMRAGIRIDHSWWRKKYEEHGVPLFFKYLGAKFNKT